MRSHGGRGIDAARRCMNSSGQSRAGRALAKLELYPARIVEQHPLVGQRKNRIHIPEAQALKKTPGRPKSSCAPAGDRDGRRPALGSALIEHIERAVAAVGKCTGVLALSAQDRARCAGWGVGLHDGRSQGQAGGPACP